MKAVKFLLLAVTLLSAIAASAQLSKETKAQLRKAEDTLKQHSYKMVNATRATERFVADSAFIRTLVRSLKTPYSFDFPFDSLQSVSRIYSQDSAFRIFTWQFMRDETYFRQRGAIQMRTADGSLKLFPLIDMSEFSDNPVDSLRSNLNWVGAIYYNVVTKTFNNKKYYTLLGYDENNFRSTRKWMEVLTFNEQGQPQFGGRYFTYPQDGIKPAQPAFRFLLEYKKDGGARINYDPELDMVVFDHLVSESRDNTKKYSLVPDGDFEGFRWKDGQWIYVEKIFDFKLRDGQFPVENTIRDATGKINEAKLLEQSKKNMEKAEKKPEPKKDKKPVRQEDEY
jgi:outer membrane lipoprotein-sorting protein